MARVGITTHILDAVEKIQKGQFEAALVSSCIAVAATAEKEYPKVKQDNAKFKNFIKANTRIIGFTAFNINAPEFHLGIDHPKLQKKRDPKTGTVPLDEIIYHAIRCGLLHEGELHKNIEISQNPNTIFSVNGGKLTIGHSLAVGLIISVILSPKYSGMNAGKGVTVTIGEKNIALGDLWGKRASFVSQYKL